MQEARGRGLGHAIIPCWPFDLKPRLTLMTTAPTPSLRDQASSPSIPLLEILEIGLFITDNTPAPTPPPTQTLGSFWPFPSILLPCVWEATALALQRTPSLLSFSLIALLAEFPAQGDRQKKADPPVSVCDSGSQAFRGCKAGVLRARVPPLASSLCQREASRCVGHLGMECPDVGLRW